jgi:ribosomal protein S12 methylthiotransferase accessory factor
VSLMDGATYMGRPERAHAFEFLLGSPREVPLSALSQSHSAPTDLSELLKIFCELSMQVVAVDLTTKEARQAGLYVVRVLVPDLQPLSFNASAQYLGHSRLYSAPPLLGFQAKAENELNRWPQPFA